MPSIGSTLPTLFDHTPDSLAETLKADGQPAYRAKQILHWVYRRGVAEPEAMTDLPQALRDRLPKLVSGPAATILREARATDGTIKLLLGWEETLGRMEAGQSPDVPVNAPMQDETASMPSTALPLLQDEAPRDSTECVMIPATSQDSGRKRRTACVSSQVGCPVGCKFCASGLEGLERNLTTGQIVEQAWRLHFLQGESGPGLTNVVFMGMGEPMVNLKAVVPALFALTQPWGLNLSARRVTVSTVGVPAGIRKLAEIDLPVTLAISLHAPNDQVRQQIIPWASFVSVADLCDAGSEYFAKTGREITLEYILLHGINDRPEHAQELAEVSRKLRSNINLIRYNEVESLPFERPMDDDVRRFQKILLDAGRNVHIRASRGRDIAAACGQLRRQTIEA